MTSIASSLDLLQMISNFGVVGILFLVIWAGAKGWWVYGHEHRRVIEEKERWKTLALKKRHKKHNEGK